MKLRIILKASTFRYASFLFKKTNRAVQENGVLKKVIIEVVSDFNFNYLPSNASLTQI
jgi:hypothetical protein